MADLKAILGVVPTIQAASLLKKKKKQGLIGYGTQAIVGTSFIAAESDIIGGI